MLRGLIISWPNEIHELLGTNNIAATKIGKPIGCIFYEAQPLRSLVVLTACNYMHTRIEYQNAFVHHWSSMRENHQRIFQVNKTIPRHSFCRLTEAIEGKVDFSMNLNNLPSHIYCYNNNKNTIIRFCINTNLFSMWLGYILPWKHDIKKVIFYSQWEPLYKCDGIFMSNIPQSTNGANNCRRGDTHNCVCMAALTSTTKPFRWGISVFSEWRTLLHDGSRQLLVSECLYVISLLNGERK